MTARTFPTYSRSTPTRQFSQLVDAYRQMHSSGYERAWNTGSELVSAEATFPGDALPMWSGIIRTGIRRTGSRTLLDYGSGKGRHYETVFDIDDSSGVPFQGRLQEYWDGIEVNTYEPALGDMLPDSRFDCVVNADVLEHCFAGDLPWIVDEMFSKARLFLFCNVACYPAVARLPSGENAHITVRDPLYWRGLFDATANRHPGVDYVLACSHAWGFQHTTFFSRGDFEEAPDGVFSIS